MSRFIGKSVTELESERDAIGKEIASRQVERQKKANAKRIGNCYLSNEIVKAYSMVVGLNEYGHMRVVRFLIEENDEIRINRTTICPGMLGKKISRAQWDRVASRLINVVSVMLDQGKPSNEQTSPPRRSGSKNPKARGKNRS